MKRYSDKDHPLSQKEIIKILKKNYHYEKIRRQTVQSNLEKMIGYFELDEPIIKLKAEDNYQNGNLGDHDDKDRRITNLYYDHKLSDPELLLIIDSILFSKQIAVEERKSLIRKLEDLSSLHFNSRMGNISSMSYVKKETKELEDKTIFDNIKDIDQAIIEAKQISFNYKGYLIKGNKIELENKKNHKEEEREYIINPYHMAASTGRYYLICNNENFNNISTYRVDRISNIKILDKKRKPLREIDGIEENFNLNNYMDENIYMFPGKAGYVKLRLKKIFLNEFMDWFRLEDINVHKVKEDYIVVGVRSNLMAMRRWALRYALYVRVLSPEDLAEDIKKDLEKSLENYQ